MKIMLYCFKRCRLTLKLYVVFSLSVLSIFAYLFLQFLNKSVEPAPTVTLRPSNSRHFSKLVTVVFRQFEDFENDIADSVQSFVSAYRNVQVLVVCESTPYPPIPYSATNETLRNLRVVTTELRLDASMRQLNPLSYITTDFVLFVPDYTRVNRRTLQGAILSVSTSVSHALAIGVGGARLICQHLKWDYSQWTLQYSKDASGKLCDAVHGHHALLIRTSVLRALPQPLVQPFPEALYLQTATRFVKVQIQDAKLGIGRGVLRSPDARQRASRRMREYRIALYKQLGVKAVIKEDGLVQWFGCKRETQRCFPSVQGVPSYILAGRNTPPCCLRNMHRSATHVLKALIQSGARCWLETTSLLGAVMHGELLPWAEYAEIGIHASDVSRVSWLQRGGADADGFVWERATKGHYYRVAYSATNKVYALVLPFRAKNGTMWPADWVLAHQREFPERHLHPLAQIKFAGKKAPAPNDARAFLDLKLGASAIERCDRLGPKMFYT